MTRLARHIQSVTAPSTQHAPATKEDTDGGLISQEHLQAEMEHQAKRSQEIHASLEAIAVSLEQYRDEGLTLQSAAFLQHALEALGITVDTEGNRLLPALESFDGPRSRLATSIALEVVQEQIKKVAASCPTA